MGKKSIEALVGLFVLTLALALMLNVARRIPQADQYLRLGRWPGGPMPLARKMSGARLGIVGMGRIGQAIARRAAGFDMKVIYHNRNRIAPELERKTNAAYVSFDDLLAQADFIVLQVPYSAQTHHLIGALQLAKMKPTAILINSTRGGVVDDAALIAALKNGMIRGAGLDVFENEPKLNPGFLELDNVVLAPHIGSSTEATRKAMAMLAAQNLVAALRGAVPPNLLNPEARLRR